MPVWTSWISSHASKMKPITHVNAPRLTNGCRETNDWGPYLTCSLRRIQTAGK